LETCDAVLFAGSRPTEISWIERFLSQGKHVLVADASWLTRDTQETSPITSRVPGARLSVVNPDHYLPSRQLIKQQIEAGKLGAPGLVRIHRWEAVDENSSQSGHVPPRLVLDVELAEWLIGSKPELIYATEAMSSDEVSRVGRTIQVHVGFPGGVMALIDYSNALPAGDGYRSLSVIGSAGAAYADDHQNVQLLYQGQHPQAIRVSEEVRRWTNLTQEFVTFLQSTDNLALGNIWNATMRIADVVEQSLALRQAVAVGGLLT
jgi:predicted dehydrogenase